MSNDTERTNVMCEEWEQLKNVLKLGFSCTVEADRGQRYSNLTISIYRDSTLIKTTVLNSVESFVDHYIFKKLETKKWHTFVLKTNPK